MVTDSSSPDQQVLRAAQNACIHEGNTNDQNCGRIRTRPKAFTLIELIAVIVVLAVLAGVAIPKFIDHSEKAKIAAARAARAALVQAVNNEKLNDAVITGGPGNFPSNLDDVLQSQDSGRFLNPYHDARMPVYNIDRGGVNKLYMQNKTIEAAVRSRWGSIWYNPNNGRVMFRVPQQANNAATIALFNEVNQTNITSLNQTR